MTNGLPEMHILPERGVGFFAETLSYLCLQLSVRRTMWQTDDVLVNHIIS